MSSSWHFPKPLSTICNSSSWYLFWLKVKLIESSWSPKINRIQPVDKKSVICSNGVEQLKNCVDQFFWANIFSCAAILHGSKIFGKNEKLIWTKLQTFNNHITNINFSRNSYDFCTPLKTGCEPVVNVTKIQILLIRGKKCVLSLQILILLFCIRKRVFCRVWTKFSVCG